MRPETRTGLVLTSGGARGAYQAGVLAAIADILPGLSKSVGPNPFPILTGVSAGAINAAFLAAHAHDFRTATRKLTGLWAKLVANEVFLTDTITLSRIGIRWLADLSIGGLIGSGHGQSLLDTAPLRRLLSRTIDFHAIRGNIAAGTVHGLAVTATNYFSGTAVSFYDGADAIEPWLRAIRIGLREEMSVDHLMASSAIPIFFPAIQLGHTFYGDGCIRLTTPISPAIHLGADRVLAIGTRYRRAPAATVSLPRGGRTEYPTIADIAGVLLNAMFLDGIEADTERMARINQTLRLIPENERTRHPSKLREIPLLTIQPSQDLGSLILQQIDRFPRTVRHLLRGLGASEEKGWDLLSYLAFDSGYTKPLLELGYDDGITARDEIERFFEPAFSAAA